MITFDDFDIPEKVKAGIRDAGFTEPTPIQEKTLPYSLKGQDVAGQAQTGTGKTAAFLISIFSRLARGEPREAGLPRALILAPTRELALQIYNDAVELGKHTGLTITVIFGGMDYQKQRESIRTGSDVVIATPGRLMDYHRQKVLILSNIEMVVVDEADRMFDMGFIKDIRYILRRLPSWEHRQSMLFSATLDYRVLELSYEHMNMPVEVTVEREQITAEGIEQKLYHVEKSEKFRLLLSILEHDKPDRVIIFSNTKSGVESVSSKLNVNGWETGVLTGDIPQDKRLRTVARFKKGEIKVLAATDVASRGLHVDDISHVINFDLPQDPEDYVHRIGRTARAGATGKAVALVDEDSAGNVEGVQKYLGIQIESADPGEYPMIENINLPPRRPRYAPAGSRGRPGGGGGRNGGGGRGGSGGGGRSHGGPQGRRDGGDGRSRGNSSASEQRGPSAAVAVKTAPDEKRNDATEGGEKKRSRGPRKPRSGANRKPDDSSKE